MSTLIKSKPASHPVTTPSAREQAAAIACEANQAADRLASERMTLETQVAALGRRRTGLVDLLERTQRSHATLAREAADAALLTDVGLATGQTDDGEVSTLVTQMAALQGELAKVAGLHTDLAVKIAGLIEQEAQHRRTAEDAPTKVLLGERAALVAETRRRYTLFLLSCRQCGAWSKEHDLLGLSPEELLRAKVKPIVVDEVRYSEPYVVPLLRPHFSMDTTWLDREAAALGSGEKE